jgi:UDP:flavonoid glycosyltransferase YjiC (YdhE family)
VPKRKRLTVIPHQVKKASNLMKIGFIGLFVPGHFNPVSAVARQPQSRDHDVVLLSLSSAQTKAKDAHATEEF